MNIQKLEKLVTKWNLNKKVALRFRRVWETCKKKKKSTRYDGMDKERESKMIPAHQVPVITWNHVIVVYLSLNH